jgi:hypothetical protein
MEKDVRLLSANGNVGGCSFSDRIGWSGNVLLLFVLGELLIRASLMFLQKLVNPARIIHLQ